MQLQYFLLFVVALLRFFVFHSQASILPQKSLQQWIASFGKAPNESVSEVAEQSSNQTLLTSKTGHRKSDHTTQSLQDIVNQSNKCTTDRQCAFVQSCLSDTYIPYSRANPASTVRLIKKLAAKEREHEIQRWKKFNISVDCVMHEKIKVDCRNGKCVDRLLNEISTTYQQLQNALNQSNKCSFDSECTSEPTGSRACGGPNGYVVYSTAKNPISYVNLIKDLAKKTRSLEDEFNHKRKMTSICSVEMQPRVECVANRCVKNQNFFFSNRYE
jgi:hypothetical protein